MEISTSILSVEKENAVQTFYNIETAKTDYFHIDVMDGKFVKQDTRDFMVESVQTLKQITNIPLDVHLMVQNVKDFLEMYLPFYPGSITMHYESFNNIEEIKQEIEKIKENGVKAGISIKPNTPVKNIIELLPFVNLVLVMTVEPGLGGQKLIPETVEKIKELYRYRENNGLEYYIEADGGINLETIDSIKQAGADIAVAGTAIVKADNMGEVISKMKG